MLARRSVGLTSDSGAGSRRSSLTATPLTSVESFCAVAMFIPFPRLMYRTKLRSMLLKLTLQSARNKMADLPL